MPDGVAAALSQEVADPARVLTSPAVLDRLSHDFYWYSPMLRPQLAGKTGDIAVQPVTIDEVLAVMRFARRHEIPVTVRGAGTGNYGQCVPLHGGIVLDLSLMDKLEGDHADGVAVCQPGLRLGVVGNRGAQAGLGVAHVSIDAGESFCRRLSRRRIGWHRISGAWRTARLRQRARLRGSHDGGRTARRDARRAQRFTRFCTRGGPTAFSRASGLRWHPRSNGRRSPLAFDSYDQGFAFTESIAVDAALDQAAGDRL